MIPRHGLPFGIGKILSILVSRAPDIGIADLEKACADAFGVRSVILLPSVRAGIRMAVQAVKEPGMIVAGPAYTCETVHQAMAASGAGMRFVDTAPGSFLMSPEAVSSAMDEGSAIVLSEVYGIAYHADMLDTVRGKKASVRILDMAMSYPSRERLSRLEDTDVALVSFGWGKPMYAGWGGIACFQDQDLAGKVREIRDRFLATDVFGVRSGRNCTTLLQVVSNQRQVYGLLHEKHLYRWFHNMTPSATAHGCTAGREGLLKPGTNGSTSSPEWSVSMTSLHRKLVLHNLQEAPKNIGLRRDQARIYSTLLVEPGIVAGPGGGTQPQSHFPIRIPASSRAAMCDYLRGRGIDTSILFPFPQGLSRESYPHAARAADEVIALPLGPGLTVEEVRMISRRVKEGLSSLGL